MSISMIRPGLIGALTLTATLIAGPTLAQTTPVAQADRSPVVVASAKVTVSGTSNVLDWSATTSAARTANVKVTRDLPGGDFFWVGVIQPGAVESFDVIVPVAELSSDRDNFTADMHRALKADQFPDIVFSLVQIEKRPGGVKAIGVLRVAGVEKEVTLPLVTTTRNGNLLVLGSVELLMTDFGIEPPTAMMGMLKTDPKVTIAFETVLAKPST
jgi:hypothetical protein